MLSQKWGHGAVWIEHFSNQVEVNESGGGCEWGMLSNEFRCQLGDGDPPVEDGAKEGGNCRGAK